MIANTGSAKSEAILTRILNSEETASAFRKCAMVLQKKSHRPITHVNIPGPSGEPIQTIFEQEQLEAAFTERNSAHFSQADGTPFTQSPLASTFGPYGTNEASRQLLLGQHSISPATVSEVTFAILSHLPLPNTPPHR